MYQLESDNLSDMADDHIKRCDVRVPIHLYEEIEKIAVEEYNAPNYHKTGRPQVSGTIIELLKLGIATLKGEVSDKLSDKVANNLSNEIFNLQSRFDELEKKFNALIASNNFAVDKHSSQGLTDSVFDNLSDKKSNPK